jgi:hypothetical protein
VCHALQMDRRRRHMPAMEDARFGRKMDKAVLTKQLHRNRWSLLHLAARAEISPDFMCDLSSLRGGARTPVRQRISRAFGMVDQSLWV